MKVQPKQACRSGVFTQFASETLRRPLLSLVILLFALSMSFMSAAALAQDQSTVKKAASESKVDVEPLDQLRERISMAQGRERSLLQNQLLERMDAPMDERFNAAEELIQKYSGTTEYWLLGNGLSSKGTVTAQRGDLAGSIELLSQAEEVLEKVKGEYPEDYFDCRCNKAAFLLSSGQSEKATGVLQECIEFSKPYGLRLNVPYAHILLAHLAEGAGAVEQALESLETAFRTAVDSKKTRLAAMAGETIVAVLFVSQQYELANEWVKRAEPYIRDGGDPRILFSFRMRVEDLRRVNGDPQTAVTNLKTLLANADGTIDRPITGGAYLSLISAQLKAGQFDDAIATADLAIERLQGFERNLLQAKVNRLAAFFEKADYELVERESAALIDGSKATPVLPTIDLLELRVKTLEKLGRLEDALRVSKDLRDLERKTLTERATEQANFISIMFRQEQQAHDLALAQKEKQTSEDKQKFLELNAEFLAIKSQRERWIRNAILIGSITLLVVTVLLTRMMLNRRASRELAEREREYNRLLSQKLEDQTRAFVAETKSRRQLELAVEQKHRDEALGKLTGGVAHDFNNLLMVILNSCELARTTGPKLPAETEQLLESSIRAAESGASIVRQLLAYAKQQPLAPRMTSVADWFAGASPLFRRTVGHLISFTQEDRSGHAVIRIDIARLTTAVINLLANARDAIPSVGSVRLTVLVESNGATHGKRWPSVDAESVVMIEITDSGTGMSPEILAHACEPFFTTKTEGTGTGLGLSSVVGFVRQSGGDFELSSTVGQGTTARILLPLITATSESLKTIKIAPKHSDQRVVLLVEDQDSLRFVISVQLKALGYEVVDVPDAAAAVQWLEKSSPPEIVISDVRMPGSMNGIQLRSWIRSRYPSVHVILMSGHLDVQVDPDVVFLQKPVTQQDLKLLLGSLPV